jgi:hypothetical protein
LEVEGEVVFAGDEDLKESFAGLDSAGKIEGPMEYYSLRRGIE